MQQATSIAELTRSIQCWKDQRQSIALIPTMGNLHAGHLSLIEEAQSICDRSICSIFVNPMQFGANEDFNHYPRTLEQDIQRLESIGCDLLYLPTASELYPQGLSNITKIIVTRLTDDYEAKHRPEHFTGVATIVLKLFNIIKPQVSIFGKKDFQQYRVIQKMVSDLNLDIEIIGAKTTREVSGLATSSRNQYLTAQQKSQAALIHQTLQTAAKQILSGVHDYTDVERQAAETLNQAGFDTDYYRVCDAQTLQAASAHTQNLVILVAARLSNTRLLDNIEIAL